jgi:hypothetical protein
VKKLFLKDGVKINGAHFYPEMVKILDVARDTAPPTTDGAVWITSANDSKHKTGSLHYKNRAFDIRIVNIVGDAVGFGFELDRAATIAAEATAWSNRMALLLGPDYDVLMEGDHIHAEYDPKPHPYIGDTDNMRITEWTPF